MDDAFDTLEHALAGPMDQWRTDLRMVTTVSRSDAPVYTFPSFEVEDGSPGAVRV